MNRKAASPLLILAVLFIAGDLPAKTCTLPTGEEIKLEPGWLTETRQENGEEITWNLHWRASRGGPFITIEVKPPEEGELEVLGEKWIQSILTEQTLQVSEKENYTWTPGNSLSRGTMRRIPPGAVVPPFLSRITRYKCQSSEGKEVILDTKALRYAGGILWTVMRTIPGSKSDDGELAMEAALNFFFSNDRVPRSAQNSPREGKKASDTPVPAAEPTPPDPAAGEHVNTHRDAIVVVTDPPGGGFVCNFQNHPSLFTSIPIGISSPTVKYSNLNGEELKTGRAYLAVGRDVMAMEVADTPGKLEMHPAPNEILVGEEVVILGDSHFSGVLRPITGKVTKVVPEGFELDCEFEAGAGGSAVVQKSSGKVIGMAAYLIVRPMHFIRTQMRRQPDERRPKYQSTKEQPRRIVYRIDDIPKWEPVDWPIVSAEAQRLAAMKEYTTSLGNVGDNLGSREIGEDVPHNNPSIRSSVLNWEKNLKGDENSRKAAGQQLGRLLRSTCDSDTAANLKALRYDYFIRQAKEEGVFRAEVLESIAPAPSKSR